MEKNSGPVDADSDTSRHDRQPLPPQSLKHVVSSIERTRSRHTMLGRYYVQRALLVLCEPGHAGADWVAREPAFDYFLTPDSRPSSVTILTELGRLPRSDRPRKRRPRSFVAFVLVSRDPGHGGSKNVSWRLSTSTWPAIPQRPQPISSPR